MTVILNLGCGTKVSDRPQVVNVDWSAYLRIARNPILRRLASVLVGDTRARRLRELPTNVRVHDLRKGIPWPDGTIDAVYHSHLLEHLDREVAPVFLKEIRRVLRPGGVHRIVVPDLEPLCRDLVKDLNDASEGKRTQKHDARVAAVLEQCVRRTAFGSSQQRPVRRGIENLLFGDARRRGETHQWLYDALNLGELLEECGFTDIAVMTYQTSNISLWRSYRLDEDDDGSQYKPGSLYMEARAPT